MFCPNCGTNNPDGSKFCSECGTVFNTEAETPAVTENVQPEEQPAPVQTVDQIIEGITPGQSGEGEKPTVDQIIEEIAPEKPSESAIPEPPMPEQPAVPPMPEQPAVPQMPEQPAVPPMPEQPVAPSMPQQPMPQYQQPMQPQQPPMYGSPYPQQPAAPRPPKPPRKPMDPKTKKKVIIGGACGAVLVAFLIVLFTAIIPHAGLKGRLRYTWTRVDSTRTYVMDLKSKKLTIRSTTYPITNWQASGDRLALTYRDGFDLETVTYVVAFSPDGKKLYVFDAARYDDGDSPDMVFVRGNYVQSNPSDLLW